MNVFVVNNHTFTQTYFNVIVLSVEPSSVAGAVSVFRVESLIPK